MPTNFFKNACLKYNKILQRVYRTSPWDKDATNSYEEYFAKPN